MPINLQDFLAIGTSPFAVFVAILRNGGLIFIYPIFVWMCWHLWLYWIQNKYLSHKKFVLLAVDVPKLNEQSMKAVEQIMNTLHGVHRNFNKKERLWLGMVQDKFSLEIISIDGYIQYFVYCDNYNADLVKGAIYAQYPDAEIVEVEDYATRIPLEYPQEYYDSWSTEFLLAREDVYPIKTYEHFEHSLTGVFADPMAAVLEIMSRLRKGEQVWLQFVITPEGSGWREKGLKEINKLVGRSESVSHSILDIILDVPIWILGVLHDYVFTSEGGLQEKPEKNLGNFMNLTTGEKIIIEEIQKKISGIPWKTKFRFVYFAEKSVFQKSRVVLAIFGVLKQFNSLDMNSFRPGKGTVTSKPVYYLVQYRQNRRKHHLLNAYRFRSNWVGEHPFIMSHVELATVWHFPILTVRAPLVSKTEAKKGEPPSTLPIDTGEIPVSSLKGLPPGVVPVSAEHISEIKRIPSYSSTRPEPPSNGIAEEKKESPPTNLPIE